MGYKKLDMPKVEEAVKNLLEVLGEDLTKAQRRGIGLFLGSGSTIYTDVKHFYVSFLWKIKFTLHYTTKSVVLQLFGDYFFTR